MRTLVRWSLSSLRTTTPSPFKAEPSRRMALSLLGMLLEIPRVDGFEARLRNGKAHEASARTNHRGRRFRPHVALGQQQEPRWSHALHSLHARDGREARFE